MTDDPSRFVGSVPENYDRCLGPRIFEGYAEDMAQRVASHKPSRVLELAAGTGILTKRLRDLLPDSCEIVATDLNEPMLEVAKQKTGNPESIVFQQADGTELPFDNESFELVACQFGVMFFPDKHRGYTEVLRVLEPGGTYLFNAWDSREANPFSATAHSVIETMFPEDPPGFYQVPFHYHDVEQIRRDVSAAGFRSVDVERVAISSRVGSAADFAQGLVFGNPLSEEILSRGGNPQAAAEAIARAIEETLEEEMPLSALVIEATKG
jgi:ubiquinone/menaquinone biosynthesis C-methylase UbiE